VILQSNLSPQFLIPAKNKKTKQKSSIIIQHINVFFVHPARKPVDGCQQFSICLVVSFFIINLVAFNYSLICSVAVIFQTKPAFFFTPGTKIEISFWYFLSGTISMADKLGMESA
jgi:hypothetical protein